MWTCIRCHTEFPEFTGGAEANLDSFGLYFMCPVCGGRGGIASPYLLSSLAKISPHRGCRYSDRAYCLLKLGFCTTKFPTLVANLPILMNIDLGGVPSEGLWL